ncbi:CDP-alcohol phosphatidyltransferase family protein [Blattabacterium cuenoti]|uniref:CDP-alcohol phosphatidyltransferase family protein n=1 Tax=Blattabacterium cuenoti TaxID=1653831 RepID=UPI00163B8AA0|nr:CDP-alcohol phosphatidyltransferase family protein [Blattabacterium cuenoti]
MIRIIPNFFTLINLFFGCISIILLQQENFSTSFIFTMISIIFDFLDGFLSRIMKINSKFGKELDSLSDIVSFGIVPSIIAFILLKKVFLTNPNIKWVAFFICMSSAYRLAKFNINKSINGLTTPVNTLFFYSLLYIIEKNNKIKNFQLLKNIIYNPIIIICIIFLSCYLLNSKILMISFNFKGISWNKNKERYIFLFIGLFLLLILNFMIFLFYIIIIYIITSIFFKKNKKLFK